MRMSEGNVNTYFSVYGDQSGSNAPPPLFYASLQNCEKLLFRLHVFTYITHISFQAVYSLFSLVQQRRLDAGLPVFQVSGSHTITRAHTHSPQDSTERVMSSSLMPLPTQQTQETNVHALSGIRTRDPSDQVAADLRPHGHREGRIFPFHTCIRQWEAELCQRTNR